MKATFEMGGTIIDIGQSKELSFGERDTTGQYGSQQPDGNVCIALYQRDLHSSDVRYKAGLSLKPSEARAIASALLSAATEVKVSKL